MAKIFISHRGRDSPLAVKLANDLKAEGHQVWLDVYEIEPGDSIVAKINEGLEDCNILLLCYSSKGVQSPWISREWMSALARRLDNDAVRIIPIVLSGEDRPAILADIKYIDMMDDWNSGFSSLLQTIA